MQNKLTQALGLGDIESLPEYNRLTEQILTDNFLYMFGHSFLILRHPRNARR
jgi:hypothetical protein